MEWQTILTIGLFLLELIVSVLVAFALLFLRDLRRQVGERREETQVVRTELQAQVRELRGEMREKDKEHTNSISAIHEMLPRQYVLRDDYVRTMASVDKKLDLVIGELRNVGKNLHEHVAKGTA